MSIKVSVAFVTAILGSGIAAAATPTLSSKATAASLDMSVASTVVANVAAGTASGSTPGAYDVKPTLGTISQTVTLVDGVFTDVTQSLSGRVVSLEAATGFPASLTATGNVSLANAGTSLQSYFLGAPLASLGFTVDAIGSTTTVGAGTNGLFGTGTSTISGLRFTGGLLGLASLDGVSFANAGANSVFALLPGLSLTLNEQLVAGDGTSALSRQTNALHLAFNDFGFGGQLFNGSLILGHSEAAISGYVPTVVTAPVPEPASWAMMIVGFGATGAMLRRSRRVAATA